MVLRTKFIYEICKVLRMITGLYSHFLPSSFNIEREYRHYGIYPFTSTEEKNEVKKNAKIFTKLTMKILLLLFSRSVMSDSL